MCLLNPFIVLHINFYILLLPQSGIPGKYSMISYLPFTMQWWEWLKNPWLNLSCWKSLISVILEVNSGRWAMRIQQYLPRTNLYWSCWVNRSSLLFWSSIPVYWRQKNQTVPMGNNPIVGDQITNYKNWV